VNRNYEAWGKYEVSAFAALDGAEVDWYACGNLTGVKQVS